MELLWTITMVILNSLSNNSLSLRSLTKVSLHRMLWFITYEHTRSAEPGIQLKNSELILHFDIKCSLRLGSFPGCPPTSRSLLPLKSRQSGVVASSSFDWSASWVIETEISADQAIKLTQDGILLNTEVLLDTESPELDRNRTGNGTSIILETKIIFILFLISSLF